MGKNKLFKFRCQSEKKANEKKCEKQGNPLGSALLLVAELVTLSEFEEKRDKKC